MHHRLRQPLLTRTALTWAALLGIACSAVRADGWPLSHSSTSCCPPPPSCLKPEAVQPPAATQPGQPAQPQQQPGQAPAAADQEPSISTERGFASPGETVALATPGMQGDLLGIPALAFASPRSPGGRVEGVIVPSIRGFKIGEDQSPRPEDRVYFGFNYYDEVNRSVNHRLGDVVSNVQVYRETFGVEKTLFDKDASIGLRLPLHTLDDNSFFPGLAGSNTDIGNLTVILKYAPWRDRQTGSLVSGGLCITTPTGPRNFAGSPFIQPPNSTTLQPWVGYIWAQDKFFVHGFTSVDVPTNSDDATMLYNDVGVGYYVYQNKDCGSWIHAVVPTLELHVNTPLNHRGAFNFTDQAATPDWVDFTVGANLELGKHAVLSVGFVTPVTGPKPYDFEVLTQFNIRF